MLSKLNQRALGRLSTMQPRKYSLNSNKMFFYFCTEKENKSSKKKISDQEFKKQYLDKKETESVMNQYENIHDSGFSTFSSEVDIFII